MAKFTPMMEQYFSIKKEYPHCLLFFRMGDFYELFFEDAIVASKELEITLTGRECGMDERAPMCGVPYHSVDPYIARLIEKNYKVAICEQTEDPKQAKTIVKREVVRVITRGTVLDSSILEETKNNFIMSIFEDKTGFGLAVADVSTGEFLITEVDYNDSKKIIDEIAKYSPSEIMTNKNFPYIEIVENIFEIKINMYNNWAFEYANAYKQITDHYKVLNLEGFGIEQNKKATIAAGSLLSYLYETQKNSLLHITNLKFYFNNTFMNLDLSSRKNLELTETIQERSKKGSLLGVLDKTKTSMGARLLRKWIESPLIIKFDIDERLNSVEELKNDPLFREEVKEILDSIYDIPRIISKIIYKTCNARDLISLKNSIANLPALKLLLSNCKTSLLKNNYENLDTLKEVFTLINKSILDDAPFSVREGNIIKDNYNEQLDLYRKAKNEGTTWLLELETKEKLSTGIKNLKIKYNKIFGYYIEITNSYKNLVPDNYIRRQTLANCERFTIEQLKEIENTILNAEENINSLEYELFNSLISKIELEIIKIQKSTDIISIIDVITSLAEVADKNNYCKPELNSYGVIDIKDGRHPVIESISANLFVANDTLLDPNNRLSIITGPNMSGKSTYMRQTALIVLMAQVGSFVPAISADIGIVDRIFTRVGASDNLATGQSTFMVEMVEVANILNNATKNSLLILDEIGRGTSTFDGLSIAWAVLEYIANTENIGAKTLFATHYHELTELEGRVEGVVNYCITVEENGDDIIFLRKIEKGGAQASYGIHVAKLAGIPNKVLERADEILELLNETNVSKKSMQANKTNGITYGTKKKSDSSSVIINELIGIDIDSLTPREALKMLYDLQTKSKDSQK